MIQTEKPCRALFEQAIEELDMRLKAAASVIPNAMLYAGHILGNVEKVYLGACSAMMVRPPTKEGLHFDKQVLDILAPIYGIEVRELTYGNRTELWAFRDEHDIRDCFYQIEEMVAEGAIDTAYWHICRGKFTGVASGQIDPIYHKRYEEADGYSTV